MIISSPLFYKYGNLHQATQKLASEKGKIMLCKLVRNFWISRNVSFYNQEYNNCAGLMFPVGLTRKFTLYENYFESLGKSLVEDEIGAVCQFYASLS